MRYLLAIIFFFTSSTFLYAEEDYNVGFRDIKIGLDASVIQDKCDFDISLDYWLCYDNYDLGFSFYTATPSDFDKMKKGEGISLGYYVGNTPIEDNIISLIEVKFGKLRSMFSLTDPKLIKTLGALELNYNIDWMWGEKERVDFESETRQHPLFNVGASFNNGAVLLFVHKAEDFHEQAYLQDKHVYLKIYYSYPAIGRFLAEETNLKPSNVFNEF